VNRRAGLPLAGLIGSQATALTANRMLIIMVPWLALSGSNNPAHAGLVGICHTAPYVLTQILSGPVIDRIGPRKVAAGGDLISALAITVLAATNGLPLWLLAIAMAAVGAADGPAATAKSVWLPAATIAAGKPIEYGAGLATAVERGATTVGPIAAGLLLTGSGEHVLWLVAALFAAAATVTLINGGQLPRRATKDGYLRQLQQGAGYFTLHDDNGWTYERSERWLTAQAASALGVGVTRPGN
jgi:MFS family permease